MEAKNEEIKALDLSDRKRSSIQEVEPKFRLWMLKDGSTKLKMLKVLVPRPKQEGKYLNSGKKSLLRS